MNFSVHITTSPVLIGLKQTIAEQNSQTPILALFYFRQT